MTIIATSVNQIDAGMIVFQDRLSEVSHNTPLVYIDVSVTKLITHPTTPFTTKRGHLGVFHGEKIHFSTFFWPKYRGCSSIRVSIKLHTVDIHRTQVCLTHINQ